MIKELKLDTKIIVVNGVELVCSVYKNKGYVRNYKGVLVLPIESLSRRIIEQFDRLFIYALDEIVPIELGKENDKVFNNGIDQTNVKLDELYDILKKSYPQLSKYETAEEFLDNYHNQEFEAYKLVNLAKLNLFGNKEIADLIKVNALCFKSPNNSSMLYLHNKVRELKWSRVRFHAYLQLLKLVNDPFTEVKLTDFEEKFMTFSYGGTFLRIKTEL